jgi:hypothetical protein
MENLITGVRYSITFYFIGTCGTEIAVDVTGIKNQPNGSPEPLMNKVLLQLPRIVENPRQMTEEEVTDYIDRMEQDD